MKKANKTARIDMKVSPELKNRIELLAEQLGNSRNQTIEGLMWKACLSPEYIFALCPTCNAPIFDKEQIGISEGIHEVECYKHHTHFYDFEFHKWIR